MHFTLVSTVVALAASTSVSARHGAPLRERATSPSTCSPETSSYLWNVLAPGHKMAWQAHNKYTTKVKTRFTEDDSQETNVTWNLVNVEGSKYKIQTADGSLCLQTQGEEGKNIASYYCSTDASVFDITCTSCGTSSCGDPFASSCTVVGTDDLCVERKDGKLISETCDGGKAQKWDFVLA
ncbi:hypothetical protein JCM8547_002312 [Rhodosporidiobolus lusitaniae]